MTDTSKIQEMREAFERTNSRDHRRQPPKGSNYIDPMAQADWESFQKGWQASRQAVVVELPGEWISVHDERKPEQRCDVLVSVKYVRHRENEDGSPCDEEGSEVAMGEYVPVRGHVLAYFDSYSAPHGEEWWITHWMALPSPADEGVKS